MMTTLSKRKILLYLAAIFCAGGVSGWVLSAKRAKEEVYSQPLFDKFSSSFRQRLHGRLNLTTNQAVKIDAIIDKNSKEMQAIHGECQRRFRQGFSNRDAQIAAVLTPEQQKQFEELQRERREAFKARDSGHRGPGRPHSRDREGTNSRPASSKSQRLPTESNGVGQP